MGRKVTKETATFLDTVTAVEALFPRLFPHRDEANLSPLDKEYRKEKE